MLKYLAQPVAAGQGEWEMLCHKKIKWRLIK